MKWTLPGIRRLREAVERGETDAQIAARLGTTIKAVENVRHVHRILRTRVLPRAISPEDLRAAVDRGDTDAQIAARVGLTVSGIKQARIRYGIRPVTRRPSRVDRAALRAMIEAGRTDKFCAEKLGVSEHTIRVQRRAMGIIYNGAVTAWRGAKPLSADQIDAIRLADQCGWSGKRIMRDFHIGPARLKRILEQA